MYVKWNQTKSIKWAWLSRDETKEKYKYMHALLYIKQNLKY